jgi:hypothetical protein
MLCLYTFKKAGVTDRPIELVSCYVSDSLLEYQP